jgi:Flp pilus assembly protein TadD
VPIKDLEALPILEKALEIEPNRAEVPDNLGVAVKELDRLKEAKASLRQAIKLKLNFSEATTTGVLRSEN